MPRIVIILLLLVIVAAGLLYFLSASVDAYLREGDFADALTAIQRNYPSVEIGSYPFNRDGRLGATLVARGTDRALLTSVVGDIVAAITALGGETQVH